MSEFGHSTQQEAAKFAKKYEVDIEADKERTYWISPAVKLAKLNETGTTEQHITDTGADYLFSQLDYFASREKIQASRMIATILAGNRTELAYWTEAAPTKEITVHQGLGRLSIGKPGNNEVHSFNLDPEITPTITLPSGVFYTFKARQTTPEPLVVSGFYDTGKPVDWEEMEIAIDLGQSEVVAPEGTLQVPNGFRVLHAVV